MCFSLLIYLNGMFALYTLLVLREIPNLARVATSVLVLKGYFSVKKCCLSFLINPYGRFAPFLSPS